MRFSRNSIGPVLYPMRQRNSGGSALLFFLRCCHGSRPQTDIHPAGDISFNPSSRRQRGTFPTWLDLARRSPSIRRQPAGVSATTTDV
jgi:hypothetical protein